MVRLLVMVLPPSPILTEQIKVSDSFAPLTIFPMLQVPGLNSPVLTAAETKVVPVGQLFVTEVFSAVAGPLLRAVMV